MIYIIILEYWEFHMRIKSFVNKTVNDFVYRYIWKRSQRELLLLMFASLVQAWSEVRMVRRLLPFSKECRWIVSVYYSRIVYVVLIWGWMLERTFAGDWRVKLKQSFPQARINYPTQLSFLLDWENKTKEKLRFLEVDFFL